MGIKIFIISMLCPLLLCSQSVDSLKDKKSKGIYFETGLSWEQVKQKAKVENKYIFVDAYATWCVPCKQMDATTYTDEKVGDFFNQKFISVKIQMDKTIADNEQVRNWYKTAKEMENEYGIHAYPTLLFFTPDGNAIHKAVGGYSPTPFLKVGANALDPESQYYILLKKYTVGAMDTAEMRSKALVLRVSSREIARKIAVAYLKKVPKNKIGKEHYLQFMGVFFDDEEVRNIAVSYVKKLGSSHILKQPMNMKLMKDFRNDERIRKCANTYINQISRKQKITTDIVDFIGAFTKNVNEPAFVYLWKNSESLNKIKGQIGYAENIVTQAIYTSDIWENILKPKVSDNDHSPDWKAIETHIEAKYGKRYVQDVIILCKETWHNKRNEWEQYCNILIQKMDKYGEEWMKKKTHENWYELNNLCYDIFEISNDSLKLNRCCYWIEKLFERNKILIANDGSLLDTYANILYKLGKKEEAIKWQQRAVNAAPNDQVIFKNYEKIEQGIPTWPQKYASKN